MTAWDELQQWLMMNVGSKQADECLALVEKVIVERRLASGDWSKVEMRGQGGAGGSFVISEGNGDKGGSKP